MSSVAGVSPTTVTASSTTPTPSVVNSTTTSPSTTLPPNTSALSRQLLFRPQAAKPVLTNNNNNGVPSQSNLASSFQVSQFAAAVRSSSNGGGLQTPPPPPRRPSSGAGRPGSSAGKVTPVVVSTRRISTTSISQPGGVVPVNTWYHGGDTIDPNNNGASKHDGEGSAVGQVVSDDSITDPYSRPISASECNPYSRPASISETYGIQLGLTSISHVVMKQTPKATKLIGPQATNQIGPQNSFMRATTARKQDAGSPAAAPAVKANGELSPNKPPLPPSPHGGGGERAPPRTRSVDSAGSGSSSSRTIVSQRSTHNNNNNRGKQQQTQQDPSQGGSHSGGHRTPSTPVSPFPQQNYFSRVRKNCPSRGDSDRKQLPLTTTSTQQIKVTRQSTHSTASKQQQQFSSDQRRYYNNNNNSSGGGGGRLINDMKTHESGVRTIGDGSAYLSYSNELKHTDDTDDDELSSNCPSCERLPGDGCYDDDDDPDAIDDLDDDEYDEDDDEDDCSTCTSTTSHRSSATSVARFSQKFRQLSLTDHDLSVIESTNQRTSHHDVISDVIKPALRPSLFSYIPPTIYFHLEQEKVQPMPWDIKKLLRWKMSSITPNVAKNLITSVGFRPSKKSHDWIGYWGKHMKSLCFKTVKDYQKVNHFPGSFQIGRKDRLFRNLSRLQVHHGKKEFGFFPQSYVLPYDFKQLKRAWEDGNIKQKWIIKPPASARGIGIRVIHKWSQVPKKKPVIVQKYLYRPFLINGNKFDLRIYIFVTSYDPLRVYMHEEGLVRFATAKYSSSMKSLSNKFMHLTNYSINKKNVEFTSNSDDTACQGHKWSLRALWGYLKKYGINTNLLWESIKDTIIKTIIASESAVNSQVKANVKNRLTCNELFGFDIFLDENLKPWVLEVNISPSLHSNSKLDVNVKAPMVRDVLNLSGYVIPEKEEVMPTGSINCITKVAYQAEGRLVRGATLSSDERAKHAFYVQKHVDECRMTIIDNLTSDDIRMLLETEDEFSRRGGFERIFPASSKGKYLKYFDQPRYYNLLLQEWLRKFGCHTEKGLMYIESYCKQRVHLKQGEENIQKWSPVAQSPRIPLTNSNMSISSNGPSSLPRLKKSSSSSSHLSSLSTPKTSKSHTTAMNNFTKQSPMGGVTSPNSSPPTAAS